MAEPSTLRMNLSHEVRETEVWELQMPMIKSYTSFSTHLRLRGAQLLDLGRTPRTLYGVSKNNELPSHIPGSILAFNILG
jgi:hypothetical protein